MQPAFASLCQRSWYQNTALSYGFHLIATGRAEAIVSSPAKLYDIAPFMVILQEAGGKMTTLDGSAISLQDTSFIGANSVCHQEIVEIFEETWAAYKSGLVARA
ncbi:MAG: hypothetical protein H6765_05040 [Candidatus Peribacteria bacterium]|nr:MAG: hypothetical protein H6765_05040 [Candidatus Peribacteria bacterium]